MTIADLIDETLGDWTLERARSLTPADIESLAGRVNSLYSTPITVADDFCIYGGGWVARNLAGGGHRNLLASLVYAPSVLIHDPFAEFFEPGRANLRGFEPIPSAQRNANDEASMSVVGDEFTLLKRGGYFTAEDRVAAFQEFIESTLPGLAELAPLIRAGVVVPISEIAFLRRYSSQLHSAVRQDVRNSEMRDLIEALARSAADPARSNSIRGLEILPTGGVARGHEIRAVVQNPAFYLEKTLAIAAESGARYVPQMSGDAALLEYRLRQLGQELRSKTNGNVELKLLPALVQSELPFLQDLNPELLLRIRNDERAFEEWRTQLRNVARLIERMPSEGNNFAQEARDVLNDGLLPLAAEVRKTVSSFPALRDITRDAIADLGITLGALGYTSAAVGHEAFGFEAVFVLIATPLKWAWRALSRTDPPGLTAVIAQLIERR